MLHAIVPWLMTGMRMLAGVRRIRGSWLDVFGKTAERRMERELIDLYEKRMLELLQHLTPDNIGVAAEIAAIPGRIRGFGHLKIANVALAREMETALLHRFDPVRYPKPEAGGHKVSWMAQAA